MAALLLLGAVFVAKQIKEEFDEDDVKEERRRLRVVEKRIRTPIEGHVTFSVEKREKERRRMEAQIMRPSKATRRARQLQARRERAGVQENKATLRSGSFDTGETDYIPVRTVEYAPELSTSGAEKKPARLTPITLLE